MTKKSPISNKNPNDNIPDDIKFKGLMEMSREDVAELFLSASDPLFLELPHSSIIFALDCTLIIFNLGSYEILTSAVKSTESLEDSLTTSCNGDPKRINRLINVIIKGLLHESYDVRAKALHVSSVLLHKSPEIIFLIISRLTTIIIDSRNAISFIKQCFPHLARKEKVHSDAFLSLITLAMAERFDDHELRKELHKILCNLLILSNLNREKCPQLEAEFTSSRKKDASKFLYELAKPYFPAWVKILTLIPMVEMISIRLMSPIASALLNTNGPNTLVRTLARKKIVHFLINTYSKKIFPCNALEIEFFLADEVGSSRAISSNIARLYRNPDFHLKDQEEIIQLSRLGNGLLTWYLYTLIPYYFSKTGEQQAHTLELIKRINNQNEVTSKYVAVSSLWIISKYLLRGLNEEIMKETEALYEAYSIDFILNFQAWITFSHINNSIPKDKLSFITKSKAIEDTLNNSGVYGCNAVINDDVLTLKYDNGVLLKFSDYLARRKRLYELPPIIIQAVGSTDMPSEYLAYAIKTVGDIGEHFPSDAIEALESLTTFFDDSINSETIDFKRELLFQITAKSLAQIARIHPNVVFQKVNDFPKSWKNFVNIEIKSKQEGPIANISHAGESLYQRILLGYAAREVFAKGIEDSGKEENLDEFFSAFSRNSFDWVINDPNATIKDH